jgi:hypothetical protein
MSKLLEILANKDLADTQEIKIGEETYNLGDLRAVNAERETFRTERDTIARERDEFRGKLDKQSETVIDVLGGAHKRALAEVETPPEDPRKSFIESLRTLTAEDDGTKALFEDKVFGKALSAVEERAYQRAKKDLEAIEAKIKGIDDGMKAGFEGMTRAQISERAERWYSDNRTEIPKGEDGKKLSLQAIHKYGAERGMVRADAPNLVDYDRVLEVLTEPARAEARMTEAEKKGYEKGLQDGRAAAGKVIPIFGDRSAGGTPGDKISTVGKSAKQIVSERLAQGLADLSAEEAG